MNNAKPGAGLPFCEKAFIKYILVPFAKLFLNWDNSLVKLKKEVELIKKLIKDIPQEKLTKRVEIDRVFGIEEHSRDYSINMTLEHLTIVGTGMMGIIDTLTKEQDVPMEVKIEAVKPKVNSQDAPKEFSLLMRKYYKFIENHPKTSSIKRKRHPWFVEFNNEEWATFTYIHTFVHRRQIQAIIKKLN